MKKINTWLSWLYYALIIPKVYLSSDVAEISGYYITGGSSYLDSKTNNFSYYALSRNPHACIENFLYLLT